MRKLVAALGLVLLGAAPASAHVIVDTDNRDPGARHVTMAVLVQSEYPDGSQSGTGRGSSTTRIVLHLPDGVSGIAPEVAEGWTVAVAGQVVTWSGGSLPPGGSQLFDLRIGQLPDVATVTAPVEQSYSDGREVDWHDALTGTHPAPVLMLDGSSGTGGITSIKGGATASTVPHGSSHTGLLIGAGALAVLAVGAAAVLRRRPG